MLSLCQGEGLDRDRKRAELADVHMVSSLTVLADPRLPTFMVVYLSRALAGADEIPLGAS